MSREKYGLTENDKLVVVGNPPWNDTSSLNKRYGTNKKDEAGREMDSDIKHQVGGDRRGAVAALVLIQPAAPGCHFHQPGHQLLLYLDPPLALSVSVLKCAST